MAAPSHTIPSIESPILSKSMIAFRTNWATVTPYKQIHQVKAVKHIYM